MKRFDNKSNMCLSGWLEKFCDTCIVNGMTKHAFIDVQVSWKRQKMEWTYLYILLSSTETNKKFTESVGYPTCIPGVLTWVLCWICVFWCGSYVSWELRKRNPCMYESVVLKLHTHRFGKASNPKWVQHGSTIFNIDPIKIWLAS